MTGSPSSSCPGQTSPGSGAGYPPENWEDVAAPDIGPRISPMIRSRTSGGRSRLPWHHSGSRLEHERKRADAAEQQAQALRSELVEARVAERVAVERARMLEAPIRWRWWRWSRGKPQAGEV